MLIFLAVQDSSIGDIVSQSLSESDFWFQRYNDYNGYNETAICIKKDTVDYNW